jgi:membrane protease YdiL (CAAX protease family)
MKNKNFLTFIAGFIILFLLYHMAEYMIVFKNNSLGFLIFQGLFLFFAWKIGEIQFQNGLNAWGLKVNKKMFLQLLMGLIIGVIIYATTFLISLLAGTEKIVLIPSLTSSINLFFLFVFGNFFSSFSEDILTRGYWYAHFYTKINNHLLILISALIYVLNHIYRLSDGLETYLYLFLLGILFMIPLLKTKQIWTTGGIHWAGNCTFYYTHEIIHVQNVDRVISSNYILTFVLFLTIFILLTLQSKLNFLKFK